jgi:hypothetical protein
MRYSILFIFLLLPCLLTAQPPQSATFTIAKHVLDAGGGASASADFRLVSAFGQSSPLGWQYSGDFTLSGGFLSPRFEVAPHSSIQELVIYPAMPDVRLYWEPVDGAAQYNVYRSTDPLFVPNPSCLIATASATNFTDTNVIDLPAMKYFYAVTAVTARGASVAAKDRSNPVLNKVKPVKAQVKR